MLMFPLGGCYILQDIHIGPAVIKLQACSMIEHDERISASRSIKRSRQSPIAPTEIKNCIHIIFIRIITLKSYEVPTTGHNTVIV